MPTRYIVHGTDQNNQSVQKIIEAQTAQEAERTAGRLGISVVGVEVDPTSRPDPRAPAAPAPAPDPADFPDDARAGRRLGPESHLWQGSPSQWVNFWWFVLCLLVIPIPWAIWKYLVVRTTRFTLTTQRLRLESGVLNKVLDEIELYRIKDTQLHQTVLDRMLGIGTIEILSSDETNPTLFMRKIPAPREVREQLRTGVERLRLARGVRELDLSVDSDPHLHH